MTTDLLAALRCLAEALPPGSAVPVPRETLLELVAVKTDRSALTFPAPVAVSSSDRLLTATAVAAMLGTSPRWVWDHKAQLGAKRLSARCLRFSESAVRRYLERSR